MGDTMGLMEMGGAAGAGDAIGQVFDQRMQAARLAQQQKAQADAVAYQQQALAQTDALTRLKIKELTDAKTETLQARKDAEHIRAEANAERNLAALPTETPLSAPQMQEFTGAGISGARFAPTPIGVPAPPPSLTGPDQPQGDVPMPGTVANSPTPSALTFHRIPTPQEQQASQQQADEARLAGDPNTPAPIRQFLQLRRILPKGESIPSGLVVPPKDPDADMQRKKELLDYAAALRPDRPDPNTTRVDRSYDTQTKRLDALEKPLADQAERIGRLRATIAQMTPQADALIAPELLTSIAGGQGSGLRMNEAEISRVVGGRNNWQDLKTRLEAWQVDPTKPFSVTPEQRKQMRALITAIAERGQKRLSIIDDARSSLADATDVSEHRRIVDAAKKTLNTDALGSDEPAGLPTVGGMFQGSKVLKVEKVP